MSKITKLAETVESLIKRVDPLGITGVEYDYLVTSTIKSVRDVDITEQDYVLGASDILTEHWTIGNTKLQPYRNAVPAVEAVAQCEAEIVNVDGSETVVFTGYPHDVALALYLMDLMVMATEKSWGDFVGSDAFKDMTRSQGVAKHKRHIRECAAHTTKMLIQINMQQELAEMENPFSEKIRMTKMGKVRSRHAQAA